MSLLALVRLATPLGHTAEPMDRPPDAMVVSSCFPDSAGFVDVDGDGVDELSLQVDSRIYTWPSSRGEDVPVAWDFPGAYEDEWVEMSSADDAQPAQILWMGALDTEYTVDPVTLELQEAWRDPQSDYRIYVSDIDGDGADDITDWEAIRLSRSGTWQELPRCCGETPEFFAWMVETVGDLNQDGFGDVVLGQRTIEDVEEYCSWLRGPAQLYFGSPDGLQSEPVWTLSPEGHAMVGVGGRVAAIPGEDTLVVTMVKEGLFCDDPAPGFLGVIRDASTPDAYFDQIVELPEYEPSESMPYLYGLMDDGSGGHVLVLAEGGGGPPDGVRWYRWEETGLASIASQSWSHSWVDLDVYFSYLTMPTGRRHQVYLDANIAWDGTYELLIWGRSPEEVGPSGDSAGSTAAGCTFWSMPYVGPDPVDPPDDTGTGGIEEPPDPDPDPPVKEENEDGCGGGCTSSSGASGVLVALVAMAVRKKAYGRGVNRSRELLPPPRHQGRGPA